MRKIQKSKITIITVVKNGMPYIEDSINSFNIQTYNYKELVVVCAKSTDGTLEYLKKNKNKIDKLIFDNKSQNKYEAINLGIKKATGNIIGVLHSDDFFYDNTSLSSVSNCFLNHEISIVFGNLIYVQKSNKEKILRYWKSSQYKKGSFFNIHYCCRRF